MSPKNLFLRQRAKTLSNETQIIPQRRVFIEYYNCFTREKWERSGEHNDRERAYLTLFRDYISLKEAAHIVKSCLS